MEYSMEFHGTNLYFIWRYQSSMEFHGIYHGIPWNTCVIWNGALLIPWNPMELVHFLFVDSRVPWKIQCKFKVTWYWIKWQSESSLEFHGTKWYFIWRYQSYTEFHGIFHGTLVSFETAPFWNRAHLKWNSMEVSHISFGGTRVPWNLMKLADTPFGGTRILWNFVQSTFHGTSVVS